MWFNLFWTNPNGSSEMAHKQRTLRSAWAWRRQTGSQDRVEERKLRTAAAGNQGFGFWHPNWIKMIKLRGSGDCAPSTNSELFWEVVQEMVLILKASQPLNLIHGWALIFNLTSTICVCPVLATLASTIVTLATQAEFQGWQIQTDWIEILNPAFDLENRRVCSYVFSESKSLWSKEGTTAFGTLVIQFVLSSTKDRERAILRRIRSVWVCNVLLPVPLLLLSCRIMYIEKALPWFRFQRMPETIGNPKKVPKHMSRLSKPLSFSALLLLLLLQPLLELQCRN